MQSRRWTAASAVATLAMALVVSVAAPDHLAGAAVAEAKSVWAAPGTPDLGSTGGSHLNAPLVDLVATPSGEGYWLLAQDGGVFAYGDAVFHGSTGAMRLNKPVVAMAATPTGRGYLFVASDGGVFAFGDAPFRGSVPGSLRPGARLNNPIVGVVLTGSGGGYWMVASDGGVFAFGDAKFLGSLGGRPPATPIEAFVSSKTGNGYWMVDRAGRTYAFGDAPAVGPLTQARYQRGGAFSVAYGDDLVADAVALPDGSGLIGVSLSGQLLIASADTEQVPPAPVVRLGPGQHLAAIAAPRPDRLWIASTGTYTPRATSGGPYTYIRNPSPRWSACGGPIRWLFNPEHAPPNGLELVQESMSHVAAVTGHSLRFAGTSRTRPIANQARRTVVIGWHPSAPSGGWSRPIVRGSVIVAGSVELNARQIGGLGGLAVAHGPGTFGSVLLHELGHVFGLGHVNAELELMGNGMLGRFGPGDLTGLARLGRLGC